MELEVITNSSATAFYRCRKLYYWRYELALRPITEEESEALQTGSAMHVGAEAYTTQGLDAGLAAIVTWMESQPAIGDDVRKIEQQAARARAMLRCLAERWPTQPGDIAERVLSMPILNPETGAPSRTFRFMGKCDKIEGADLVDWKGVSEPADFVKRLIRSFQVELYAAAAEEQGITIHEAIYRLVKFPTIKLCGKDASATAYENRCVEWLKDDPANLVEHRIMLNPARIAAAKEWLWDTSKDILDCRRSGRWGKNGMACKDWNRTCEYDALCTIDDMGGDVETLVADRYRKSEPHPELAVAT